MSQNPEAAAIDTIGECFRQLREMHPEPAVLFPQDGQTHAELRNLELLARPRL